MSYFLYYNITLNQKENGGHELIKEQVEKSKPTDSLYRDNIDPKFC